MFRKVKDYIFYSYRNYIINELYNYLTVLQTIRLFHKSYDSLLTCSYNNNIVQCILFENAQ